MKGASHGARWTTMSHSAAFPIFALVHLNHLKGASYIVNHFVTQRCVKLSLLNSLFAFHYQVPFILNRLSFSTAFHCQLPVILNCLSFSTAFHSRLPFLLNCLLIIICLTFSTKTTWQVLLQAVLQHFKFEGDNTSNNMARGRVSMSNSTELCAYTLPTSSRFQTIQIYEISWIIEIRKLSEGRD